MPREFIEIFGTLASVVVAISLTMKNIKRLRILNFIGAVAFTAYGLLIGAVPVWLLNAFVASIDLYYLIRMELTKSSFMTIESSPFASPYVKLFLEFYRDDIKRFQPDFALDPNGDYGTELILRDMMPVSLVIYRKRSAGEIEIVLDYAVASYRDYKNAEYYFGESAKRIASGGRVEFVAYSSVPTHSIYLERIGFKKKADGVDGRAEYRKVVEAT